MTLAALVLAIAVLPSDRLAMADRLFNRGRYADAEAEYRALSGAKGVAADELLFRLAECDRVAGRNDAARRGYAEIFNRYPDSRHASRSRFMYAMGARGAERTHLLAELDSDRVATDVRAAALYYLGSETADTEVLARCVKLEPKGKYAPYANLKIGTKFTSSDDPAVRRKGVETLLGIAFTGGPMGAEALYLAALQCYRDRRYGEAGSLFRRYRKLYPSGEHADETRTMSVWCDFLEGRYADAAAACGKGESDDLAYIRAACAYATGDNARALALFKKYLEDYPEGHYRSDAELPVARIEFEAARKGDDSAKTVETARRSFGLSKLASDQIRLAWAYEKAGKAEAAAEEYAQVAKKFPGTDEAAEAMFRRAMIAAAAGNWSGAELALAEALATGRLGKRKAEALYWRGVAAMKLGHEETGAGFLREAIESGLSLDEAREAKLMVADFDYKSGRLDAARSAYSELVRDGACARMSASRMLSVGRFLGGAEAETCARELAKSDAAEWRQAGWALLGSCEESRESYAAAIDAYRKCLAEPARTEAAADAALRLGKLEFRAGEFAAAENTLKKAIALNASNARARAEAYVTLAKNAEQGGDVQSACAYATVVVSLFDDEALCAEAKRILAAHPEAAK
ncbi:MAG: tetratricopeptide repeat protein [Kiritimatiellae bacterium]|nr:tetratricopeptide repeat protein [Kiritimatiellia bacterium]